jgi:hypothetical protein
MTLVNARAALESAINTAVAAADNTVSVVFDNMPFTTPGKTKKYVLVTINFDQATIQAHGAAAIAESIIDGLTSVNASGYTDTYSSVPRVGTITGPTAVSTEDQSHFVSVIRCNFTAV